MIGKTWIYMIKAALIQTKNSCPAPLFVSSRTQLTEAISGERKRKIHNENNRTLGDFDI